MSKRFGLALFSVVAPAFGRSSAAPTTTTTAPTGLSVSTSLPARRNPWMIVSRPWYGVVRWRRRSHHALVCAFRRGVARPVAAAVIGAGSGYACTDEQLRQAAAGDRASRRAVGNGQIRDAHQQGNDLDVGRGP